MTSTITRDEAVAEESEPTARRRRAVVRAVAGLLLGLLSGVLATLSLEPYHLWPLAFVAFVPAVIAQHRVMPRRLAPFALGAAVGGLFQGYLGPGLYEGGVAWYLEIYGVWIALIVAGLAWRSRTFHERTNYRWFILATPLAWTALDFARSNLTEVAAGTWGYIAYALYDRPAVLQPVSVFTIHAVNLLILMTNWALAAIVITAIDRRRGEMRSWQPAMRGVAVVGALVVAWVGASVLMLDRAEPDVRIATVQPGEVDISEEEQLQRRFVMTRDAARQGAKLVIWNESGVPFDPRVTRTDEFVQLARETGTYIAVGWGYDTGPNEGLNEVTLLTPEGRFLGSYGKDHPGTFAGDYSSHQGDYPEYDLGFAKLATIICFDLDFTDTAQEWARRGATLFAVPSNDLRPLAETHWTHLPFRAIENHIAMAKADSGWDSAIIDPWGRVIDKAVVRDDGPALLVADVPVVRSRTLVSRIGDWFGWVCVLGVLAMSVIGRLHSRDADDDAGPGRAGAVHMAR